MPRWGLKGNSRTWSFIHSCSQGSRIPVGLACYSRETEIKKQPLVTSDAHGAGEKDKVGKGEEMAGQVWGEERGWHCHGVSAARDHFFCCQFHWDLNNVRKEASPRVSIITGYPPTGPLFPTSPEE